MNMKRIFVFLVLFVSILAGVRGNQDDDRESSRMVEKISSKHKQIMRYPHGKIASGLNCTVLFSIRKDGELGKLEISKSSGDAKFDDICQRAVRESVSGISARLRGPAYQLTFTSSNP